MKRIIIAVIFLGACTRSPLAPTPAQPLDLVLKFDVVSMSFADLGSIWPQPPSCRWRNYEVFNYVLEGRPTPNIVTLSDNVHQVYIEWGFVEPGTTYATFSVASYPGKWCESPFGLS